ncbi:hypothetical protein ET532_026525 [Verminephrobacter sp. Larva24]|nr:hypothetical protein ET532_026525 [Verminephrobacter sp. Larva24]
MGVSPGERSCANRHTPIRDHGPARMRAGPVTFRQELPLSESDEPVRAIHTHVRRYAAALRGDLGRVLLAVLGECMVRSGSTAAFTERYLAERRNLGVRVISNGQSSGAIRSRRPPEALYDQIFGAIFYRFLFGLDELSKPYLTDLIDTTFSDGQAVDA